MIIVIKGFNIIGTSYIEFLDIWWTISVLQLLVGAKSAFEMQILSVKINGNDTELHGTCITRNFIKSGICKLTLFTLMPLLEKKVKVWYS